MDLIKRKLENTLLLLMERREILGVRGPRQAGKTTLLKMLEEATNKNLDKHYLNLDLASLRREFEENPLDFVKRFKKEKPLLLFLDEVQRCKNAGESLKILYDTFNDVKLIISGSSSLEIKTTISPFLVGRLFLFDLLTLDFEEFLSAKDLGLTNLFRERHLALKNLIKEGSLTLPKPSFNDEFLRLWKEYIIFGGYPEVVKTPKIEEKKLILKSIEDLYIEKDIITFFKIEETTKFKDLTKALSFQASNLLLISSLAKNLNLSFLKIEEFVEILQHTYIIKLLKPFHKNLVTEIRKTPKLYFIDLGLRNSLINNFLEFDYREDKGKLTENFIFRELLTNFPDYEIKYWRTTGKAEMDFVLIKDNSYIPIEVKLGHERLGKSFFSFLESYKPRIAIVATLDFFDVKEIRGTTVYWLPVWYF